MRKLAARNIPLKPCTKLQYQVEVNEFDTYKNESVFWILFTNPPMVTVKEEYLIYDLVTMISAIGGTMSLCIGLSFKEFYRLLLGLFRVGLKKLKTHDRGEIDTEDHPQNERFSIREKDSLIQCNEQSETRLLAKLEAIEKKSKKEDILIDKLLERVQKTEMLLESVLENLHERVLRNEIKLKFLLVEEEFSL